MPSRSLSRMEGDLLTIDFDPAILDVDFMFVSTMDGGQLIATAGQFPGVEWVLLLIDGEPVCRSQGLC